MAIVFYFITTEGKRGSLSPSQPIGTIRYSASANIWMTFFSWPEQIINPAIVAHLRALRLVLAIPRLLSRRFVARL